MADPRSKLDVIYQEVLGEVASLITRLETVASATKAAPDQVAAAVSRATTEAGRDLKRDLDKQGKTLLEGVEKASGEAQAAAAVVAASSRRFALLALATGLAGGIIGGTLAGLALARGLLG